MIQNSRSSRPALFVAHPGHELRLFGWMLREKPVCMVLTTGSRSGTDKTRVRASADLLTAVGGHRSELFGVVLDRDFYAAVLAGNATPFLRWKDAAVEVLVSTRPESLVIDGWQHCFDPDVLRREQIEFCRSWLVKIEPPGPWLDERNHLLSQNTELSRQLAVAAAQNAEMTNLEGRLSHEIDKSARLQEQLSERDVTIQALTLHIDRSERARSVRLARALRRLLGWKAN